MEEMNGRSGLKWSSLGVSPRFDRRVHARAAVDKINEATKDITEP